MEKLSDVEPRTKEYCDGLPKESYALYPHMTVYENMAFGQVTQVPKMKFKGLVMEAAKILDLENYWIVAKGFIWWTKTM